MKKIARKIKVKAAVLKVKLGVKKACLKIKLGAKWVVLKLKAKVAWFKAKRAVKKALPMIEVEENEVKPSILAEDHPMAQEQEEPKDEE